MGAIRVVDSVDIQIAAGLIDDADQAAREAGFVMEDA
jgi:hypothetical protein